VAATSFFGGAFFGGEFFNTPAPVAALTGGAAPPIRYIGNFSQSRVEDEAEKLARRIREGTIPAPVVEVKPDQTAEYVAKSARLAQGIAKARAEAQTYRAEIGRLEKAQIKRQTAKLQSQLLRAQQAHQLACVQEAVFLEEMEVMDIAYVASAVLRIVLQ